MKCSGVPFYSYRETELNVLGTLYTFTFFFGWGRTVPRTEHPSHVVPSEVSQLKKRRPFGFLGDQVCE